MMCVFNLLPLPPLDGSGALGLLAGSKGAEAVLEVLRHPQARIIGFIIAWKVFDIIYPPIQLCAVNLLYPGLGYQ